MITKVPILQEVKEIFPFFISNKQTNKQTKAMRLVQTVLLWLNYIFDPSNIWVFFFSSLINP